MIRILSILLTFFIGIIPRVDNQNTKIKFNIKAKENMEKTLHIIEVENIKQFPELATGCEVVSLTILLNHLGYKIDKIELSEKYLPKLDFYYIDGEKYGADVQTTFAGNPKNSSSYGCYPRCIVKTAENYFKDINSNDIPKDISGNTLEYLLKNYIDNDIPVLIWITYDNLHEPKKGPVWKTKDGKTVQWISKEHCVVLTGYDKKNNLIYVSDPLYGNTSYNLERLNYIYEKMGKNAMYILVE